MPIFPLTFKPRGTPMNELDVVKLKVEEMEAIRLVDMLGMDLRSASESMKVSRRTMSRDLKSGRSKIAGAFVMRKAVVVEGGDYKLMTKEEKG